jgi:hypothetical protein
LSGHTVEIDWRWNTPGSVKRVALPTTFSVPARAVASIVPVSRVIPEARRRGSPDVAELRAQRVVPQLVRIAGHANDRSQHTDRRKLPRRTRSLSSIGDADQAKIGSSSAGRS